LEPDPSRVIDLNLLIDGEPLPVVQSAEQVSEEGVQVDLQIGDTIKVEAGPILDMNGHPVPDGTVVNFRLIYEGEELALPVEPVNTRNGIATIDVPLEHSGNLRISASSVRATASTIIVLSIHGDNPAVIAAMVPTVTPLPIPTETPPSEALANDESAGAQSDASRTIRRVDLITLSVALSALRIVGALLLVVLVRVMPRQMLVFRLLCSIAAGLIGYILYGLGAIPGSTWLQLNFYPWGGMLPVLVAMLVPLVWLQLRSE
jgi:beta-N-acetylhexosaminidase